MLEAARVAQASLPIIDIGGLSSATLSDREAVGARLRAACSYNGFFYISNHGVDEALAPQMVEHRLPVAVAEGVDDDAVVLEQQGHGPVRRRMTGGRYIGAPAAIVEIAAEGADNLVQRHGRKPPSLSHISRPFLSLRT